MASASVSPDDLNELPNVIIVKFHPSNLPSGMMQFQHLAEVIQGLQEILDEIPFPVSAIEAKSIARPDHVRLVSFTSVEGSYELTVTLASVINYVFAALGIAAPERLDVASFLELSARATVAGAGLALGRDLYKVERARLQQLITFLNDIRQANTNPITQYIPPNVRTALRRLKTTAQDPVNSLNPYTIGSDQPNGEPVPADKQFIDGVTQAVDQPVAGPEVEAIGPIVGWHSDGPHLFLSVAAFGPKNIKCKYEAQLDHEVRVLAAQSQRVSVKGVPYYVGEPSESNPPEHINIREIRAVIGEPSQTYRELAPASEKRPKAKKRGHATQVTQPLLWDSSNP